MNENIGFREHSTEYEIFCGDECLAITDSHEDARHYSLMYQGDGEVRVFEVKKTRELLEIL